MGEPDFNIYEPGFYEHDQLYRQLLDRRQRYVRLLEFETDSPSLLHILTGVSEEEIPRLTGRVAIEVPYRRIKEVHETLTKDFKADLRHSAEQRLVRSQALLGSTVGAFVELMTTPKDQLPALKGKKGASMPFERRSVMAPRTVSAPARPRTEAHQQKREAKKAKPWWRQPSCCP